MESKVLFGILYLFSGIGLTIIGIKWWFQAIKMNSKEIDESKRVFYSYVEAGSGCG